MRVCAQHQLFDIFYLKKIRRRMSDMSWMRMVVIASLLLALGAAQTAEAVVLDLTGAITDGTINGAIFSRINQTGAGTGNINAFVKIGGNTEMTEAYNTRVNNTLDNGSADNFNHELFLWQAPIVDISGTDYREFLLDINEPGEATARYLSLDEVQVFLSDVPNQSIETFTSSIVDLVNNNAGPIYRLDAGGDSWIRLDSTLAGGSGQDDMFMYLPDSLFTGSPFQYVYLYSKFGIHEIQGDGFEEWAVRRGAVAPCEPGECPSGGDPVIPEPTSLWLMGSGILGLLGFGRKRRI